MKIFQDILTFLFLTLLVVLVFTGCSSRLDKPENGKNSTIIYPAKGENGIEAAISLYRKSDKKTGETVGEGDVFSIMEDARIHARVDLENRTEFFDKPMMFHFDWVGANGRTFYIKESDLLPEDSVSTIHSSISLSPEFRKPGKYDLKIYLFRELIAEKKFEVLPEFRIYTEDRDRITTTITLCRRVSKKTGKRIGVDTVFTRKNKRRVRAFVDLENRNVYGQRELLFHLDWIGPEGNSVYKKYIDLLPSDTSSFLYSSISIAPGNRESGEYCLQVYLFNKLMDEKRFFLE